ncbi:MAG: ribonuclease VapC37 [Nitrospirales bacterium]|nr:MAG: ribonuclease VapC37 [Nitrospirales bacterium]
MKIVDLNVILYAVNEDAPHHHLLREWWDGAINGEETIGLPWIVLLGFLRLASNPSVFPRPLDPDAIIGKVDVWLAQTNIQVITEKEGHWEIFRLLLGESGMAGNLTTDAHLAALAMSYSAVLVSCDSDFARFRGLRWENPLI